MSTITAPVPSVSVGRRPIRVVTTVVVVAALLFAAFAVTRYLTRSTTVAVVPSVDAHDAVEHHADAVAAASARIAQHDEHLRADMATPRTFATSNVGFGRSLAAEQVGGAHATYPLAVRPVRTQLDREQIGGAAPTFPLSPVQHTTWTNTWVPPYDDPTWAPWIHAHYYGTPVS